MDPDTLGQFLKKLPEDAAMQSDLLEFAAKHDIELIESGEARPDGVERALVDADSLDRLLRALSEDTVMQSEFVELAAKHDIDLIELGDQELDRVVGGSRGSLLWPWPQNISEAGFSVEEVRITLGKPPPSVGLTPIPPPSK